MNTLTGHKVYNVCQLPFRYCTTYPQQVSSTPFYELIPVIGLAGSHLGYLHANANLRGMLKWNNCNQHCGKECWYSACTWWFLKSTWCSLKYGRCCPPGTRSRVCQGIFFRWCTVQYHTVRYHICVLVCADSCTCNMVFRLLSWTPVQALSSLLSHEHASIS